MARKVLFLDLDRTLLDTPHFMQSLWREIAKAYNAGLEHQMAQVPHWYRAVGDYHYYDLRMHLQEGMGLDPDAVLAKITLALQKEDFLYPDASELAAWLERADYEVRVLTFGPPWVQQFKISLVPAIAKLPCDMILEAKKAFIAREYAGRQGLLVDDKRNPGLPDGFTEVWLNRDSDMDIVKEYGIITIKSLTQVRELL